MRDSICKNQNREKMKEVEEEVEVGDADDVGLLDADDDVGCDDVDLLDADDVGCDDEDAEDVGEGGDGGGAGGDAAESVRPHSTVQNSSE
mmetsp:Transcript_42726/g.107859  ORF Transcript_42726/g.107859 Transcript_42726/m.107859 type:complete len:90 (+) Transcript_42726:72-341(+)